MSHRFYQELNEEFSQTKRLELRGKLHPKKQIRYNSRVHTIHENLDLVIFFSAVIGGFAFMVFLIIVCSFAGGLTL